MAYNLKINNKTYVASDIINDYNGNVLTIKLYTAVDVIFFHKWELESKANGILTKKMDYVKDIQYIKILNSGVIYNCYPILDDNEKFVKIYFDYIKIEK